ncbi:hypothetical protein MegaChil _gp1033 [Megavirus chiliensis]|uniref:Uncharacterized protein mg1033 n=1 Tax=Megavirus chiliensis TaxID=1094892 RepID=G5CQ91_9VIRU|nr:hypothetical protein MegaChil _gp1033 [Megavirus chiliensis]
MLNYDKIFITYFIPLNIPYPQINIPVITDNVANTILEIITPETLPIKAICKVSLSLKVPLAFL